MNVGDSEGLSTSHFGRRRCCRRYLFNYRPRPFSLCTVRLRREQTINVVHMGTNERGRIAGDTPTVGVTGMGPGKEGDIRRRIWLVAEKK